MSAAELRRLMSDADGHTDVTHGSEADLKEQLWDNAHAFLQDLGFDLTREEAVAVLIGSPEDRQRLGVKSFLTAESIVDNTCGGTRL